MIPMQPFFHCAVNGMVLEENSAFHGSFIRFTVTDSSGCVSRTYPLFRYVYGESLQLNESFRVNPLISVCVRKGAFLFHQLSSRIHSIFFRLKNIREEILPHKVFNVQKFGTVSRFNFFIHVYFFIFEYRIRYFY